MTCQSYLLYIHFRGVTKWPTQACTIPSTSGTPLPVVAEKVQFELVKVEYMTTSKRFNL